MPIQKTTVTIKTDGKPRSGKTTMLQHAANTFRALGYQVDDSGATKEHHILVSWPQEVSDQSVEVLTGTKK